MILETLKCVGQILKIEQYIRDENEVSPITVLFDIHSEREREREKPTRQ